MSPHAARVLTWFLMSAAGCLFFWVAFRGSLAGAYRLLADARERYRLAGGDKLNLDLAIGNSVEISSDLLEAKEHLSKCEANLDSIIRQRRNCFIFTPGVIAIVILLST